MHVTKGVSERRGQRSQPLDAPTASIGDKVKGAEEETAKQFAGNVETALRGLLLSEHKQIEEGSGRLDEGVNSA